MSKTLTLLLLLVFGVTATYPSVGVGGTIQELPLQLQNRILMGSEVEIDADTQNKAFAWAHSFYSQLDFEAYLSEHPQA